MDPYNVKEALKVDGKKFTIYNINKLEKLGLSKISKFPVSIKILLENVLRNLDGKLVTKEHLEALARWDPSKEPTEEVPYIPSRVVLQDFTGVPAVVDFAALRSAMKRANGDPARINPIIPAALVIDHSVQLDYFGSLDSLKKNEDKEFERNLERYTLLRWAQTALNNFNVVPPGMGIVHQINLEYLASVVHEKDINGEKLAFPDSLVGTDSHTTMINGLGVLGWGVGGIEAEAVMLGQPYYMPIPKVVGVKITGKLRQGINATDMVLTITQMLRNHGVVGKFVEFYGPGLKTLSLPDKATISNMSPEYGATMGFFPVDSETLKYLETSGRDKETIKLIEAYTKKLGLFMNYEDSDPVFHENLELDLSTVQPSMAGPKRPQDTILLPNMKNAFHQSIETEFKNEIKFHDEAHKRWLEEGGSSEAEITVEIDDEYKNWLEQKPHEHDVSCDLKHILAEDITHGSVVIAAITSCTNTSNPFVLIGAGLLAKKAIERGLKTKSFVKTSLCPGSRVVTDYLDAAGLLCHLEALGFFVSGYGCTTCIGNSGPLPEKVAKKIQDDNLIVASVLSGNRNFEGRINLLIKANYLASPLLVVAFAIAGSIDVDLFHEPLGVDPNGKPVFLREIWPMKEEIQEIIEKTVTREMFVKQYSKVFEGTDLWKNLDIPKGNIYDWEPSSTYIREPPFFVDFPLKVPDLEDINNAKVLALLGNTVTTDHISPAGAINVDGPAGQYLISKNVNQYDFNSFGSRRGNHEVMMRGTFGNVRIKNKIVPGTEGGWSKHFPTGEKMSIFDTAMKYKEKEIPLIVIAGKEYGTGSSRDWAAKGTFLLGIKAVIAESYERIHRSNLVGMGVLPLQFKEGENADTLGVDGSETFDIKGIKEMIPNGELEVIARNEKGKEIKFKVQVKLFSNIEKEYYQNGGILHTVLRNMLNEK